MTTFIQTPAVYDPALDPEFAPVLRESDVTDETMREVYTEHASMEFHGATYGWSAHDVESITVSGVPMLWCHTCGCRHW